MAGAACVPAYCLVFTSLAAAPGAATAFLWPIPAVHARLPGYGICIHLAGGMDYFKVVPAAFEISSYFWPLYAITQLNTHYEL